MLKVLIIDGYVDEPACLGVPPYISTYARYIYGLLRYAGIDTDEIQYNTIDTLRQKSGLDLDIDTEFKLVIVISSISVPGHYLSGTPISQKEIEYILTEYNNKRIVLFGTIYYGYSITGGRSAKKLSLDENIDLVYSNYLEKIFDILNSLQLNKNNKLSLDYETKSNIIPFFGAELVKKHPMFPLVICEIQTYSGCKRRSHCTFCIEQLKKDIFERYPEHILNEIKELYKYGIKHFRIGNQSDILFYGSKLVDGKHIPNKGNIQKLYAEIRRACPNIITLHTDNASPITISQYPDESKEIINILCKYNSEGDILALGIESYDDNVLKQNNIGLTPKMILDSIKIINESGAFRRTEKGLPVLLPGINFLFGLPGETDETVDKNIELIENIWNNDYLVRRINSRQVIKFENTRIFNEHDVKDSKKRFKRFKTQIKKYEKMFLSKVSPVGTIIKNAKVELIKNEMVYARQLASYPILCVTRGDYKINDVRDFVVIDIGFRSVTVLEYPVDFNKLSYYQLKLIPFLNKKLVSDIILARPFDTKESLINFIQNRTSQNLFNLTKYC